MTLLRSEPAMGEVPEGHLARTAQPSRTLMDDGEHEIPEHLCLYTIVKAGVRFCLTCGSPHPEDQNNVEQVLVRPVGP